MPQIGLRARRLLSLVLLAAFVATGQGVAGLELAWHMGHLDDQHERAPHFEAAGGASHADICQLTVAHPDGRLPVRPSAAPAVAEAGGSPLAGPADGPFSSCRTAPARSRAPPILG